MFSLMVSTGSNMPMKMVPMNAGDEKQHQRLGKRHGGLQLAIQVALGDVGDAHQFARPACRFPPPRKSFPAPSREKALCIPPGSGRAGRLAARARWTGTRRPPGSGCRWICGRRSGLAPAARPRRAACRASGRTAPWRIAPTSGPTIGARKIKPSQMRRPFSEANQVRTRKPTTTMPADHEQSVGTHRHGWRR